jgi:UPF0042 nucleotide-binding protein
MQLVLISGLSGSGKSIAIKVLEDAGYYCVDNLPVLLLSETTDFLRNAGYDKIAISVDARSGKALDHLPQTLNVLRQSGIDLRLLFLDAKNDTLVRRFTETRRRHPLALGDVTIEECITREREMLAPVGELGHRIDTSDAQPNALRGWIKDLLHVDTSRMTVLFQSFGYKQGIPLDSDLVFDVRFLPNPFYDPKLRPLTGNDAQVIEFMNSNADVAKLLAEISAFVSNWLPHYLRDNRSSLTIAIGCTGGQHRSVYLAEKLAADFRGRIPVLVRHRQLS